MPPKQLPKYENHPFADLFPMMGAAEHKELADDIESNGLYDKIWLYEGKVLDGRNRLKACAERDVDPKFEEYKGKDALGFKMEGWSSGDMHGAYEVSMPLAKADAEAVAAVLAVAGHRVAARRRDAAAGLTAREIEVLVVTDRRWTAASAAALISHLARATSGWSNWPGLFIALPGMAP